VTQPDPFSPRTSDLPTVVPLDVGADLSVLDEAKILAAPEDAADRPAWRDALRRWRDEARERVGYDPAAYDDPATAWATTAWNVAIVWLWDEAIWDWEHRRFDVDRLLATYDGFGGLDAVVLWHAYPVIGIDDRNQFDWYDVPGLETLVAGLHDRGVRVFVDYNPWDVGTRRPLDPGATDAARLADLLTRTGADGVFLDTLKEGDPELVSTLAALERRPVLEGESRVPLVRIADHQASWAQWFADSPAPGVLRARWFEQRHMMHHTRRWDRDHGAELRSAWVNGAGVLLWDVVFGVRVDWSAHDRATLRGMRKVYHDLEEFFRIGEWEPLAQLGEGATAAGIAGSRWTLDGVELYTLANPTDDDYHGPLLDGPGELVDVLGEGAVRAGGVAGVLRVPPGLVGPGDLPRTSLPARQIRPSPRAPRRLPPLHATGPASRDAVAVPAGTHRLTLRWRQRETGLYEAASYVDDWKPLPPRLHQLREDIRVVELTEVRVDAAEVTNAEFASFLVDSGYRPAVPHRFLGHWVDGAPTPGTGDEPVTHVDLDDARAYAAWRDARLPTEDEWQVGAESSGSARREPLVWQWTESEHRDGRTRWVVLKGGSGYAAEGSEWYVDGGPQEPTWSLRYLLTGAGTSRSAGIGFRCAVDVT